MYPFDFSNESTEMKVPVRELESLLRTGNVRRSLILTFHIFRRAESVGVRVPRPASISPGRRAMFAFRLG